jgi:hypothetical protein
MGFVLRLQSASQWRRGDALYVYNLPEFAEHEVDAFQFKKNYDNLVGEKFFRVVENLKKHEFPAIGVLVRDHRYWQTGLRYDDELPLQRFRVDDCMNASEDLQFVDDNNYECFLRRCIANCIANRILPLVTEGIRLTVPCVVEKMQQTYVMRDATSTGRREISPSADGLVAMHALVAEAATNSPEFRSNAGFIGPDDWYVARAG